MTLNVKLIEVAKIPIGVQPRSKMKLAVRSLARSRLIAAEITYGLRESQYNPTFPGWEDAYSIGVHLLDQQSEVYLDDRHYSIPTRRGQSQFLYVADVSHSDFITPRHSQEVILQRSFLREIADDLQVPHVIDLAASRYHVVDDPVLRWLALRIYPFFDAPTSIDALYADQYMWSLGIYLCARYGGLVTRRPVTGGLSAWQERLAKDVIETCLVDGIGLSELAGLCGLQTSQFSHAFKRSTGFAPYQWLTMRRVALARQLLRNRANSLVDVALACGFADQAHLTRVFSRSMGTTPGVWRAAQC
ncbi:helix-turn-helix domain-containing protein [Agrobacterium tumefaciens]|uniref:helix-turn-helix domain-containing protein n=1 Tax=Agrobacterium tumefaciens TaxID=358 RepID=UPI003BA3075C